MADRRPVWLTDDEGCLLMDTLRGAATDPAQSVLRGRLWDLVERLELMGADPEPWLTVDDSGEPVRMVPVRATLADSEPGNDPVLYRAMLASEEN